MSLHFLIQNIQRVAGFLWALACFFFNVTDNLATMRSAKSDIFTLREELFAICFEQKLSSCQMCTSRQSLV